MKLYLSVFILLIFISCEKEYTKPIQFDIEEIPNVFCLLQNDRLYIELKLTQPIYITGNNIGSTIISDASVNIINNNQSYLLLYDTTSQSYRIDTTFLKVKEGEQYNLEIHLANGKMIQSVCVVPFYSSQSADINIATYGDSLYAYGFSYTISINNDDYYEKNYIFKIESCYGIIGNDSLFNLLEFIPYLKPNGINSFIVSSIGQLYSLQYPLSYRTTIYNTNTDVYKYYISVYKNMQSDPMIEPVQVFTNINGGWGIFGPLFTN